MGFLSLMTMLVGFAIAGGLFFLAWNKLRYKFDFVGVLAGIFGVIVILIGLGVSSSFGQINAGHVGLQRSFGGFTGKSFTPGLFTTLPIVTSIDIIDVRIQNKVVDAAAVTKDQWPIPMKVSINYNLLPSPPALIKTIGSIGDNYYDVAIASQFQSAIKTVSAQYTLAELLNKRDQAAAQILSETEKRMRQVSGTDAIQLGQVAITDIELSDKFKESIEQKVVAQQQAQTAQINNQRVKYETEQAVIQAKGQAEAQQYQGRTITPEYLKLKFLEKWDGRCPAFGSCPFSTASAQQQHGNNTFIVDARNIAALMAADDNSNNQGAAQNSATPEPSPEATPTPTQ